MGFWQELFENSKQVVTWLAENKWVYLAYWIPFVVFMMRFYSKNKKFLGVSLNNLVSWAKPSLETNKHASPEKITAFMVMNFVYIPSRLYFIVKVNDPLDLLWGNLLDVVFMLVLYRLITPTEILELKGALLSYKKLEKKVAEKGEEEK